MSGSNLGEKHATVDNPSEDGDAHSHLLAHEDGDSQFDHPRQRPGQQKYVVAAAAICLAAVTFVFGVFVGVRVQDRDAVCTHRVVQDSPLLNDIPLTYSTQRFNGSLFKETIYRKAASPEVDAAWESLGINYRSVAIPEKNAEQAGFRYDQVKINKKHGGGYPANVEGLHHLHCLNLVRQSLYYNYDYYKGQGKGAFINSDHIVQAHVSHCLDIVRQQLMCTVDVGFLGQVWTNPDFPAPFVDFNTVHKCRNFDDVREWARTHQLPAEAELPEDFLQPPEPGDLIYPETP